MSCFLKRGGNQLINDRLLFSILFFDLLIKVSNRGAGRHGDGHADTKDDQWHDKPATASFEPIKCFYSVQSQIPNRRGADPTRILTRVRTSYDQAIASEEEFGRANEGKKMEGQKNDRHVGIIDGGAEADQ